MAKTRCPAKYKNLGLESFGNKKKVTEEILKQCCKNDEWLRQNIEEVRYLTPPAVRKSLLINETIDTEKSWGCTGVYEEAYDNKIQFSKLTHCSFDIDLTNEDGLSRWFDASNSTVVSDYTTKNDGTKSSFISLESTLVEGEIKNIGTAEKYSGYNSAWYVGYDKTKNFYLKPQWIKDWKSVDVTNAKKRIPAIARCQTFKVPDNMNGKLLQVDLQLEYNGVPTLSSSPLHVQLWNTYEGWVWQTKWNNETKKAERAYMTVSDFQTKYGVAPSNSWQRFNRVKVPIMKYSKKTKTLEPVKDKKGNIKYTIKYVKENNGKYIIKRKKVFKPYSNKGKSIKEPLAEYIHNPDSTTKAGEHSMPFDNTPEVKGGKHYAIVLLSPLNNWDNCPRWGGWGRNCRRDENGNARNAGDASYYDGRVYKGGDAFYSTDNGVSWHRYGKSGEDDDIKVYKQGKYAPQDFRFRCRIKTGEDSTVYPTNERKELRLKPIYCNPIYRVILTPTDIGTETVVREVHGLTVDYQLSTDGDNWYDFENTRYGLVYELDEPSRVIFIRALMESSDATKTPIVEKVHIELDMNLPKEMYVRTKPYTPDKFGTILGASVWGRVFAPYELEDDSVDCKVDIIQMKQNQEHFNIVNIDLIDEKLYELGLTPSWINDYTDEESRCEYLSDNPEILDDLKYNYNTYILPYEFGDVVYNLSFAPSRDKLVVEKTAIITGEDAETHEQVSINYYPDEIGGISLSKEVAYPIISCELETEDAEEHGSVASYGEWYDYRFDYQTNELIFKRDTLNRMANGSLIVTYNPVFIKDLTNDEVGVHYDEEGIRHDGLILDYFKEKIKITEDELESGRVKLRVDAVDPIRQVYLYNDSLDEPMSLRENVDYTYDLETHEIVFEILSTIDNSTILSLDDVIEVVYTPNLDDTSICIGYNATRTNTTSQCTIEDYYIEYKV